MIASETRFLWNNEGSLVRRELRGGAPLLIDGVSDCVCMRTQESDVCGCHLTVLSQIVAWHAVYFYEERKIRRYERRRFHFSILKHSQPTRPPAPLLQYHTDSVCAHRDCYKSHPQPAPQKIAANVKSPRGNLKKDDWYDCCNPPVVKTPSTWIFNEPIAKKSFYSGGLQSVQASTLLILSFYVPETNASSMGTRQKTQPSSLPSSPRKLTAAAAQAKIKKQRARLSATSPPARSPPAFATSNYKTKADHTAVANLDKTKQL